MNPPQCHHDGTGTRKLGRWANSEPALFLSEPQDEQFKAIAGEGEHMLSLIVTIGRGAQ